MINHVIKAEKCYLQIASSSIKNNLSLCVKCASQKVKGSLLLKGCMSSNNGFILHNRAISKNLATLFIGIKTNDPVLQ